MLHNASRVRDRVLKSWPLKNDLSLYVNSPYNWSNDKKESSQQFSRDMQHGTSANRFFHKIFTKLYVYNCGQTTILLDREKFVIHSKFLGKHIEPYLLTSTSTNE